MPSNSLYNYLDRERLGGRETEICLPLSNCSQYLSVCACVFDGGGGGGGGEEGIIINII